MDDSCIMGLLLISLAICVNKECKKATEYRATQPHCDHMEHVEFCKVDFIRQY